MLRVREYGETDKGTRVSYEIKRRFTRLLDFNSGQFIKTNWNLSGSGLFDSLTPDTVEFRFKTPYSVGNSGPMTIVQNLVLMVVVIGAYLTTRQWNNR